MLKEPYFTVSTDLPSLDFNKEIVEPGTHREFPQGVIGIRVDDDFWQVGLLPYYYKGIPIEEIVEEFWTDLTSRATYNKDTHYDDNK